MAGAEPGQSAAGVGRKRRRAVGEGGAQKRVCVGGLGVVTVRVRAGVLRLQDVVAEHRRSDDAVRTLSCVSVNGCSFSVSLGGSLLVRGGSEWTREADCDEEEGAGRTEAIGRMAREELEAGLGRGRYAVGAEWDEGSMVHAMRRFGGRTIEWRFGDG